MTNRRVVAVVPDLFFAVRISAAAEEIGVPLEIVAPEAALATIRTALPALLVLDLHAPGDPLALVRALRAEPATRALHVLGFYAHVDQALREAALAAGVDEALPRSAFTRRLPALLRGEPLPPRQV
jgi:CheY-like chemotaxis protein